MLSCRWFAVLRWRKEHGGVSRVGSLAIERGLEIPAAVEGEGARTRVWLDEMKRGTVTLSHSTSFESAAVLIYLLLSAVPEMPWKSCSNARVAVQRVCG
jgi:hypothetical protein